MFFGQRCLVVVVLAVDVAVGFYVVFFCCCAYDRLPGETIHDSTDRARTRAKHPTLHLFRIFACPPLFYFDV